MDKIKQLNFLFKFLNQKSSNCGNEKTTKNTIKNNFFCSRHTSGKYLYCKKWASDYVTIMAWKIIFFSLSFNAIDLDSHRGFLCYNCSIQCMLDMSAYWFLMIDTCSQWTLIISVLLIKNCKKLIQP